jgi:hypothetical protein
MKMQRDERGGRILLGDNAGGMDLSGSTYRAIAASFEHGSEISGFIDWGKCISN